MVVVRRLVQFCFASVKGYFPANSSVSVYLRPCLFHLSSQQYWMVIFRFHHQHLQSDFNLAIVFISGTWGTAVPWHVSETWKVYLDVRNNILYAGHHMHPQVLRDYRIVGTLWGLRCHISIVADSHLQHRIIGVFPLYSIAKQPACARSDISSSASAFELSAIQARGQPSHHHHRMCNLFIRMCKPPPFTPILIFIILIIIMIIISITITIIITTTNTIIIVIISDILIYLFIQFLYRGHWLPRTNKRE